jgi:hypothetical protein
LKTALKTRDELDKSLRWLPPCLSKLEKQKTLTGVAVGSRTPRALLQRIAWKLFGRCWLLRQSKKFHYGTTIRLSPPGLWSLLSFHG